jgi:hypothetical protein
MRSRRPFCGSRRPNSMHSGHGLPNSMLRPGTAKCKMMSRRDAWTHSRRKPSKIFGLAVARIGEASRQSEVLGLLSATSDEIRRLADESYHLLRRDPRHPSLHFKRAGRFWSARVGLHYRALAVEHEDVMVWFWVGTHAVYNRLVSGR